MLMLKEFPTSFVSNEFHGLAEDHFAHCQTWKLQSNTEAVVVKGLPLIASRSRVPFWIAKLDGKTKNL